ncbi:Leu/Phe/Val dehydrogenase [Asticcacaulis benevestitus]|uniref:Leucine dehydrogenase n=1 Tax=Asticcacaulis benevestitus DSM 16100 = ATCC BAA-896 TaxID=1121022 RepID=V4P5A7_9CAUL|nr:Glu/Leu/Phe/Val dehydrogenase dimerization domain-containing protein [Asticcacaulis benevestitus]ESQ82324.1 leucine dehydrogenase [Asticcacaulis benevestitus DSM 16100 = ATCC BAA-896]
MFDHPDYDAHDKVLMVEDAASGLKAIIAVHSTALGAAAGGCRLWAYDSGVNALSDALRLSRGMSYKNAMANLPMGGGKAVILGPVPAERREAVLEAFGRAVDSLDGQYITAEDVGVSVADMKIVARTTGYVSGLDAAVGKSGGDPSPFTARGVRVGIEAAVKAKLGRSDLAGIKVAVQGLGHVGTYLCEELFNLGAKLVVADINPERVEEVCNRFAAESVSVNNILLQTVDVVAPCALGGAISEDVASRLQATIVAGAANNQLLTAGAGRILGERGILYAPDYVINAGGIIMVAGEISGRNDEADILAQVDAIGPRLFDIFTKAKSANALTNVIADAMARDKIAAARARVTEAA